LLFQAEVFATPNKLLSSQAEWNNFYTLSYNIGTNKDMILVCVRYKKLINIDHQMELQAEILQLLDYVQSFFAEKKVTMNFPSLILKVILEEEK